MDMALPSCVDKVTKAKIPIVTGGHGASDSTELLINGIWQSGTIQWPKIATPVMKGALLFFSLSHIRTGILERHKFITYQKR